MKRLLIVLALVVTGMLGTVTQPTTAAVCAGNKIVQMENCETVNNTNTATNIN